MIKIISKASISQLNHHDFRELLREDLRIRAYLDQRFTADTSAEQRRLVDDWIAGLRRRSDVVDLYATGVSGRTPGAVPPGGR